VSAIRDLIAAHATVPITDAGQLGDAIRTLRELRGLTQRQLARLIHAGPNQVSDWETGLTLPGARSLLKLADALGYQLNLTPKERP
jgi:transcriptional regulator with XRE-family HTH domain